MDRVDRALDTLPLPGAQQTLPAVPPETEGISLGHTDDAALGASQPDEVTAQCVDPAGVVVPDENCGGTQQGEERGGEQGVGTARSGEGGRRHGVLC